MATINLTTLTDRQFVELTHSVANVNGNGVYIERRTLTDVYGNKYTAMIELADNGDLCNGVITRKDGTECTAWVATSLF
jgi:hypothetical protein